LLQEGPGTQVGIATFDSTIHFYNLKRALQQVAHKYPIKHTELTNLFVFEDLTSVQSHVFILCKLIRIFCEFEGGKLLVTKAECCFMH
jgi:hypothetical protein